MITWRVLPGGVITVGDTRVVIGNSNDKGTQVGIHAPADVPVTIDELRPGPKRKRKKAATGRID